MKSSDLQRDITPISEETETPVLGPGTRKGELKPSLASTSAVSLSGTPECPGDNTRVRLETLPVKPECLGANTRVRLLFVERD